MMLISGWADSLTVGVGLNTKYIYYKKLINNTGNLIKFYISIFSPRKPAVRWLDWIFLGGYLPLSLSINYVGMSKDMEKRLPQLYYIKMKISYDLGFLAIGVAMAT